MPTFDVIVQGGGQHGAFAHLRRDRGKAKAAIADHDRSNAMPARQGAVRIPEKLRIVMGLASRMA